MFDKCPRPRGFRLCALSKAAALSLIHAQQVQLYFLIRYVYLFRLILSMIWRMSLYLSSDRLDCGIYPPEITAFCCRFLVISGEFHEVPTWNRTRRQADKWSKPFQPELTENMKRKAQVQLLETHDRTDDATVLYDSISRRAFKTFGPVQSNCHSQTYQFLLFVHDGFWWTIVGFEWRCSIMVWPLWGLNPYSSDLLSDAQYAIDPIALLWLPL